MESLACGESFRSLLELRRGKRGESCKGRLLWERIG